MLSTVRPEPSESVLSRKGMRGLYYAFFAMKRASEWTRTAVRPEPSESVLSKRMQWALNVMFLKNRQQKCFRTDSNRHYRRRRPGLYPLSYGSIEKSIKQNLPHCKTAGFFSRKRWSFFKKNEIFKEGIALKILFILL